MFCDRCGTALQAGQGFCSQCGKEVTQGMHLASPRPSRVQEHLRLLGILWLALSALNAVGGAILFVIANTSSAIIGRGWVRRRPRLFLHPFLSFLGVLILLKSLVGFIAGWGLLQRESWARVLTFGGRLPIAVQHSVWYSAGHLFALGAAAESDREYERQVRVA